MISIIIPVYNVEQYLSRCIDNIISQTYTDWELLLVDDGSKDRSGEICDDYSNKDERIRVIHKDNGGVSSARNKGLELAKGEYITFIDSDDWVDSDYLANFNIGENNLFDLYISGAAYDVDGGVYAKKVYVKKEIYSVDDAREQFFSQKLWDNGYPWGKLYKKSIIDVNNFMFDERLQIHEDHLFVISFLEKVEKIAIVDSASYHYLVFDESGRKLSSKKNHPSMYINVSTAFEKEISYLCDKWMMSDEQRMFLERKFVSNMKFRALDSSLTLNKKDFFLMTIETIKKSKITIANTKVKLYLFVFDSFLDINIKYILCRLICYINSCYKKMNKHSLILQDLNMKCKQNE